MLENINGFKIYKKTPNTITKGASVYIKTIYFKNTLNKYKNRKIRVYLPSTYDFDDENKRFPVLYMLDGKNLFDDYTSFVGEWGVDESIEGFIKEKLTSGIIVVGIDAPENDKDRTLEMLPKEIKSNPKFFEDFLSSENGYAYKLGNYIFKDVKREIDASFYTLDDKYHTAVGGSSMGGIMSFYLGTRFKEYTNYILSFSPAFFLFDKKSFKRYIEKYLDSGVGQIFFYVGGKDFEEMFVEDTLLAYNHIRKLGFDHKQIKLIYDSDQIHNEAPWRKYFPEAIKFFNFLKNEDDSK